MKKQLKLKGVVRLGDETAFFTALEPHYLPATDRYRYGAVLAAANRLQHPGDQLIYFI